jgi:hypothetical protein
MAKPRSLARLPDLSRACLAGEVLDRVRARERGARDGGFAGPDAAIAMTDGPAGREAAAVHALFLAAGAIGRRDDRQARRRRARRAKPGSRRAAATTLERRRHALRRRRTGLRGRLGASPRGARARRRRRHAARARHRHAARGALASGPAVAPRSAGGSLLFDDRAARGERCEREKDGPTCPSREHAARIHQTLEAA